jgi:hypothetical protein
MAAAAFKAGSTDPTKFEKSSFVNQTKFAERRRRRLVPDDCCQFFDY